MKRCPQCLEAYDGDERFCELDGQELMVDPTFHAVAPAAPPTNPAQQSSERSLMVLVGVAAGVFISAVLFVVYSFASSEPAESSQLSSRVLQATPVSRSAQPTQSLTTGQEPLPRPTPTPAEITDQPEAQTSPEQSGPRENTVPARINQGPVSTNAPTGETNMRTIIQLNDGTTLNVDAAWKEGPGIWYRRGGLVSFIDSKDVKSISTVSDSKKIDSPTTDDSH